jgi:hypothetical protein
MIARQTHRSMLNDRDLLLWRRAVLYSQHYSGPPMLARLLIGPETKVSAIHEC